MASRFAPLAVFLLAIFALFPAGARAGTLVLSDMPGSYPLAPHMDMFEDKSASLKIEDVTGVSAEMFKPNGGREHFGWTKSALWFRITLTNTAGSAREMTLWVPDSWIDRIEFYPDAGAVGRRMLSGDNVPQAQRPIEGPVSAFPLTLGAGETATVHIRVFSAEDDVQLSFKLADNAAFEVETVKMHGFTLFWWGIMCTICAYSFMLSLATKNRSYFYYTLYALSTILVVVIIKGYAQWLVWPAAGAWINRVIPVVLLVCYTLSSLFVMSFLSTAASVPRLHKLIKAFVAINAVGMALSLFAPDMALLSIYVVHFPIVYSAIMIVIGILCVVERVPAASLFVVAWVCSLIGVSIYVFRILGLAPDLFFTNNAGEIGVAAESFLFLIAIGHQIQLEREAAREAVMAAEVSYRMDLKRINEGLEAQVALKTGEHLAARQEAEKAQRAAEDATRLKDKFVLLVTHDLKSPLLSLANGLETLHGEERLPAEDRRIVGMMARHSRELLDMTERLLDLSSLQAGKIIPQKRPIVCRDFVDAQIGLYHTAAAGKEIAVVNEIPADMKVYADPDLFGECVKNVLSNALKFCDGGDSITIFNPPDMPSTIAVKDSGPGIAPEKMPTLFKAEMKSRSLGTAGERGTGIGLPHAKELMEAHGGDITVESAPGGGCTFFLSLPAMLGPA